jgi:fructokinase
VAAARLGLSAAFIGKVGADLHGRFLRDTLEREGVDCRGLRLDPDCPTTLAFVELLPGGERDFAFHRKGCGDTRLRPEEVPEDLVKNAKVLHLGTLSMTDEPARSATLRAAALARAAGVKVSCDVNYRSPLWPEEADFRAACAALLPLVDWLKVSEEEAELLTGSADPARAAESLRRKYPLEHLAVTLGDRGAWVDGNLVPAFPAEAVDATGAGDSFWGAYIYALLRGLEDPASFACAAAACCVEKRGAIPAMPGPAAAEARLSLR